MAHVIEAGQYFVFRTKDIHSKGLVGKFDFPNEDFFDISVDVTLTRSHSSKIHVGNEYRRFIDQAASFDYIEYGTLDIYNICFRIVRFPIADGFYECLVTNLLRDKFPPERLKCLYFAPYADIL